MTSAARRVWLIDNSWDRVVDEASSRLRVETGGILMGWSSPKDIVVTHTIGPGPRAEHEANAFRPGSAWQAAQLGDLYEQSGRRLAYLGDWHTHPGGVARPSRRDESTLRHIASTPDARYPDPLMVILASAQVGTAEWVSKAFVLARRSWRAWEPAVRELPLSLPS